jgi:uncharacterized membrane protein
VPDVLALVLSFSAAALFWRGHTKLLAVMRESGRAPVFPALVFLLFVVFLPISTNFYGTFGALPTVALLYGGNLAVIALLQLGPRPASKLPVILYPEATRRAPATTSSPKTSGRAGDPSRR